MRIMLHTLLAMGLTGMAGVVQAQDVFNLSVGADYASGKYGTPVTSTQWTLPLVAKYEAREWSAKLSIPYVRIENPAISRDGTPLPCASSGTAPRVASGMGDTVLTLSRNLLEDRESRLLFDLTGKVKIATGDETKCLGTGENDYYLQGDFSKGVGALGVFGTLGWRKMGDPPGTDFEDPMYWSVGMSYRASPERSYGFAYDHRDAILPGRDPLSEATLFMTHRFDRTLRVQIYGVAGFSDSSPDWGAGALLTRSF